MSTTQPEALRLAGFLDKLDVRTVDRIQNCVSAAAELRRLHARIAELEAQLSAVPLMGAAGDAGWQPIETAPKDGTLIVLGAHNGVWLGKYLPVYGSGYVPVNPWSSMLLNHDHMAERYTRPTHWMPLPPAPSSDKGVAHG